MKLNSVEKELKRWLKRERRITVALVVYFLITGLLNLNSAVAEGEITYENRVPSATDYDGDGIPNDEDTYPFDFDNDGAYDYLDAFPGDANETVDTDGDGVGDNTDAFPDNPNESADTDNDGVGDNSDLYPDDDTRDGTENTDGDEIPDINDTDSEDYNSEHPDSLDTDNDGTPDKWDDDKDGDGVADVDDAFPLDSSETSDTDGDNIGDNTDPDADGDGVANVDDAFPLNPTEYRDTDGDGIGDNADEHPYDRDNDGTFDYVDELPDDPTEDTDTDGDGVGDNADPEDDTPLGASDIDGDGIQDTNDPDIDGDGTANESDAFPNDVNEWIDTDGDRVGDNADEYDNDPNRSGDPDSDGYDSMWDTRPDDATKATGIDRNNDGVDDVFDRDTDGDGVEDAVEISQGMNHMSRDTDGDGILDGNEVIVDGRMEDDARLTDPDFISNYNGSDGSAFLDYIFEKVDTTDDSIDNPDTPRWLADGIDIASIPIGLEDSDRDGYSDYDEMTNYTDIHDDQSKPIDSDGDGVSDINDLDTDGNGVVDDFIASNDWKSKYSGMDITSVSSNNAITATQSQDEAGILENRGTIYVVTDSAIGIEGTTTGAIVLNSGNIFSHGGGALGIASEESQDSINNGNIFSHGDGAAGILSRDSQNSINNGNIFSFGGSVGYGIYSMGSHGSINNGNIFSFGGFQGYGIASEESQDSINNGNIFSFGDLIGSGIASKESQDSINNGNIFSFSASQGYGIASEESQDSINNGSIFSNGIYGAGIYITTTSSNPVTAYNYGSIDVIDTDTTDNSSLNIEYTIMTGMYAHENATVINGTTNPAIDITGWDDTDVAKWDRNGDSVVDQYDTGIIRVTGGIGMVADGTSANAINYGTIIADRDSGIVENGIDTVYMKAIEGGSVYNYGRLVAENNPEWLDNSIDTSGMTAFEVKMHEYEYEDTDNSGRIDESEATTEKWRSSSFDIMNLTSQAIALLDKDGDGYSDYDEIANGTDFKDNIKAPTDTDGDGISDIWDLDTGNGIDGDSGEYGDGYTDTFAVDDWRNKYNGTTINSITLDTITAQTQSPYEVLENKGTIIVVDEGDKAYGMTTVNNGIAVLNNGSVFTKGYSLTYGMYTSAISGDTGDVVNNGNIFSHSTRDDSYGIHSYSKNKTVGNIINNSSIYSSCMGGSSSSYGIYSRPNSGIGEDIVNNGYIYSASFNDYYTCSYGISYNPSYGTVGNILNNGLIYSSGPNGSYGIFSRSYRYSTVGDILNKGSITSNGRFGAGLYVFSDSFNHHATGFNYGSIKIKDTNSTNNSSSFDNYDTSINIMTGMYAKDYATVINGTTNPAIDIEGWDDTDVATWDRNGDSVVDQYDSGIIRVTGGIGMVADGGGAKAYNYGTIIVDTLNGITENDANNVAIDTAFMKSINSGSIYNYGRLVVDRIGDVGSASAGDMNIVNDGGSIFSYLSASYQASGDFNLEGSMEIPVEAGMGESKVVDEYIVAANVYGLDNISSASPLYTLDTVVSDTEDGDESASLVLTKTASLDDVVEKEWQVDIAGALDEAITDKDSEFVEDNNGLSSMLVNADMITIQNTITEVAATEYANLSKAILDNEDYFDKLDRKAVAERTSISFDVDESDNEVRRFDGGVVDVFPNLSIAGSYGQSESSSDTDVVEYDSDKGGIVVGYGSDNMKFLAGYNHEDLDYEDSSEGQIDGLHLGGYKESSFSGFELDTFLGFEYNYHNMKRRISVPTESEVRTGEADFESMSISLENSLTKKYSWMDIDIVPSIGLDLTMGSHEDFSESGAGDYNATVEEERYYSTIGRAGLHISKLFTIGEKIGLRLYINPRIEYDFSHVEDAQKTVRLQGLTTSHTLDNADERRDAASSVDIGVGVEVMNSLFINGSYIIDSEQDDYASMNMEYRF